MDSKLPNRVAPVLPSQKVYLQAKSGQLLLGADEEKYKQTLSKAAKKDFITSSLGTLSNLKEEKDSSDAKTTSYQSIRMRLVKLTSSCCPMLSFITLWSWMYS